MPLIRNVPIQRQIYYRSYKKPNNGRPLTIQRTRSNSIETRGKVYLKV